MILPKYVALGLWSFGLSVALGIPATLINMTVAPPETARSTIALAGTIAMALMAGLGYLIFKAHNWARWLNAVLAVITFAFSFVLLTPLSLSSWDLYISWAQVILGMLAVIFLFTPSANRWFKSSKGAL